MCVGIDICISNIYVYGPAHCKYLSSLKYPPLPLPPPHNVINSVPPQKVMRTCLSVMGCVLILYMDRL